MLVTCPECGEKISSEANLCPKCGLPNSGRLSKELQEKILEPYKREAGEVKYDRPRECGMCGYVSVYWKRKESKLIRKEGGYDSLIGDVYCPKCGASTSRGRWVDENPPRLGEAERTGCLRIIWKVICISFWVIVSLAIILTIFSEPDRETLFKLLRNLFGNK